MISDYDFIEPSHAAYPKHLTHILGGRRLFACGALELMSHPAISICGSRDASQSALKWAYEFGKEAARHGTVVVSGYARGVDRQAHKGALVEGGSTIAILPEGIEHFRVTRDLKPLVDLNRNFLAVSMFEPRTPWRTWNAMERNKLIVGLSAGLFVIEARERGGTIHAAYECLRQGKRLWAVAYGKDAPGREGNKKLLATSAIPLKHTGDLRRALEEAMTEPPAQVRQLVLNLVGENRSP